VRRATPLRSLIQRRTNHLMDGHGHVGTDDGVLRALLREPRYARPCYAAGARPGRRQDPPTLVKSRQLSGRARCPATQPTDLSRSAGLGDAAAEALSLKPC